MKKDDRIYLDHILDSFSKILQYLDGISYTAFLESEEKQDAVMRKIEVAGEATKRLSATLREQYDYIPWRAIAGMRDKLIHDYLDVDIDTVWATASEDIPSLIPEIESVIQQIDKP
ncbi:MAG: DUF86 domain-containing protein [Saprospiraceae bacterium]|nr:DUF86 domain-containing protein [Saprospiraceae bacterium]